MLIDSVDIPGGGQLHLFRSGQDYEIVYGREQLMGNWATQSERALATLVCERLGDDARRLLIGGLGMGFTLAAALAAAPAHAVIDVVELVPGVVGWARKQLAHVVGQSLADPRVSLTVGDVHDVIDRHSDTYDAILLDVDNGPDGLIIVANERLYSNWGLRAAYAALRPGGILAIWSAYPDATFGPRLGKCGFSVQEIAVDAGDTRDPQRHTIWLASKSD
ncbi:spermidine synthase [Sphingomonas sp. AP4-R1]|uniref:spermidine synthase n=1 Tax=Sphingomonas sp. AP4-R1 TaxID=2735134 RepID=UPI0020A495F8|nr:spermidine synthase [Sphingomonas sp. AP4-R1]